MQATVESDLEGLIACFEKVPREAEKELRVSMKICLRKVAEDSREEHRFVSHRGNLERSVKTRVAQGGLEGDVFLDSGVAPYASAIHEGSKPHKIKPKIRKTLYFVSGGDKVFAKGVNHPGTKPDKFLNKALAKNKSFILDSVNDGIEKALAAARLK